MAVPAHDPIIVAPTNTPFRADESVDYDALARNVDKYLDTALSGFVVGSYGGEEFHMGEPEKLRCVKTVSEAHRGQRFVIAGIDTLSPTEAVRLANLYAEQGADMVRVRIPPRAGRGEAEPVQKYFETVTAGSPVPIVVIHQPKAAMSVDVTPDELHDICSLDNVFAYIISLNFRWETRVPAVLPKNVKLWTCNGALLLPGGMIGANGGCMLFANWGPHLARDIIKFCMDGRYAEAKTIQDRINHVDFLGLSWGVGVQKAAITMMGFEGTKPRRPNLPLTSKQLDELRAAMIEAGILDAHGKPNPMK
jgi:dihydrodipicolinate synthase/N-acetylneuraminate lyase